MAIDGWTELCLGEILCSKNDKSKQVKSSEYQLIGLYPIVDQSSEFICGYCDDSKKVINNELPYTIFGDHTRHTKFVNFPFVVGADGTQIIKPIQSVDDRFFFYLVSDAANKIGNYGYDRHFKHLREFRCIFPIDKKEQTQIADVLSTIDRAIAQTEAIIAKQQRIKTGLMQDLLTKGIDENGNIRSEATHEFKDSAIGRIPVEWDVAPVSKYGSKHKPYLCTGPFGSSLNTKHWVQEGVPVLTIGSLGEGELIENELFYITELTAKNLKSFLVEASDIVFSRVADIGRSLVIEVEQKGWIISSNLMRLSLDKKTTSPIYLYRNIAFNTSILGQLRIMSNSGGRDLINGAILSKILKILFPWASFEEQNRINSVLDQIDRNLLRVKQELKNQNCKKTGLMQDLLTGKVRVTNLLKEKEPTSP